MYEDFVKPTFTKKNRYGLSEVDTCNVPQATIYVGVKIIKIKLTNAKTNY